MNSLTDLKDSNSLFIIERTVCLNPHHTPFGSVMLKLKWHDKSILEVYT